MILILWARNGEGQLHGQSLTEARPNSTRIPNTARERTEYIPQEQAPILDSLNAGLRDMIIVHRDTQYPGWRARVAVLTARLSMILSQRITNGEGDSTSDAVA